MCAMEYETLYNGEKVPRLWFGTWKMGGGMSPDTSQDKQVVATIQAAIEMGYTHIDTAEMYGGGHTEELIGQAVRGYPREKVFIATKVWDTHLRYPDVIKACEGSLKRLGLDYVDMYLTHWPNPEIPVEETFRAFNELVEQGKVHHLGVSNSNLSLLKQAQSLAQLPIAADQVPYSLRTRKYVLNGVLEYCQNHNILLTAYSPIERGSVLDDPQVRHVAQKYGATPAQISLAWLIRQPGVIAVPMSMNLDHLKSNLEAFDIELFPDDVERLNGIELPEGSIWPQV
jgi:diketogulonate reductase-like aldo/keto reductase